MKAGRPCDSLKRHFSGYLRQFVGYVDLLARHDPDRFVWAQTKGILDHMVNARETFDPPSRRTTMFCRAKARELGIISGQHMLFRAGRMREGFTVAHHGDITRVTDNVCNIACNIPIGSPPGSPLNEIGSPLGSPPGSPPVLPKSDLWFTTWFIPTVSDDSENTLDITPSENFCPENVQSDSALALLALRTLTDNPFNPLRGRNDDAAFAAGVEHKSNPEIESKSTATATTPESENPNSRKTHTGIKSLCQDCGAALSQAEWKDHQCPRRGVR